LLACQQQQVWQTAYILNLPLLLLIVWHSSMLLLLLLLLVCRDFLAY
jgi:uncharacterized MAPEG superfamily protein